MKFPYANLPDRQIWKRALAAPDRDTFQTPARLTINRETKIASAGSCFASNIAASLQTSGYTYFVTEPGPLWEPPAWLKAHGYGRYTARFGDVYTTTQLLQLAQRALGQFVPKEAPWLVRDRFVDPFRPHVEPDGFASVQMLLEDQQQHLRSVRRMLEECDVLIFTLGLTEGWYCSADGAALPLCPGAGMGTFDSQNYYFKNLGVADNVRNLQAFLALAWCVNPKLRLILTVSPVPLAATMEPRHVAEATVWSKSVLRVAAEELCRHDQRIEYFAAYEIVLGTISGIDGFESDRRTVKATAVDRVMSSFFSVFSDSSEVQLSKLKAAEDSGTSYDPCGEDYFINFLENYRG